MSTKTATYYYRRFNWKEINNMFCYDVQFPERLSKKQQILRLYKNCIRRANDLEINGVHLQNLEEYANAVSDIKKDFLQLKKAKDEKEVDDMLDKYEYFIETSYQVFPLFKDNIAYEWRHQKGLLVFDKNVVESDLFGYYDPKLLDYYPNPKEWEFRDEFPQDNTVFHYDVGEYGWDEVNENENSGLLQTESALTPDDFSKEVSDLRNKYKDDIDMWENNYSKNI